MRNIDKQINFVPDFVIEGKKKRKRMFMVAVMTTICTLLGFAVYFFPEMQVFSLKEKLNNINTELRFLEDARQIKTRLDAVETKVNKKNEILKDISKDEVDVIFFIDKLINAAPENVVLTYFSANGKEDINVSYIINNPIEATNLVGNLRDLDMFEKVDMPAIPIVDRKTDIRFKLKVKDEKSTKEKAKK